MKNSKDSSTSNSENPTSSRSSARSNRSTDTDSNSRFASSDETQNIESPRSAASTESEATISGGQLNSAYTSESILPEAFAANLPPESRENIERAITRGRDLVIEARDYLRNNPAEAAGLVACSGAILWALFGTKPGRRIVEVGAPILSRYIADGINQTFALQGRQLQ